MTALNVAIVAADMSTLEIRSWIFVARVRGIKPEAWVCVWRSFWGRPFGWSLRHFHIVRDVDFSKSAVGFCQRSRTASRSGSPQQNGKFPHGLPELAAPAPPPATGPFTRGWQHKAFTTAHARLKDERSTPYHQPVQKKNQALITS